ncbi:MAG: tyrosine-type recombinase/integrase [Hoeflea sp.]|nr:tyrosine-type recombinase/integrase [Hoeflea sp.]
MAVPVRLQEIVGRTVLKKGLHTADLTTAEQLKWPHIAAFKAYLADAARALETQDPVEAEALKARLVLAEIPEDERGRDVKGPGVDDAVRATPSRYEVLHDGVIERAYQLEKTHGFARAKAYVAIATGAQTPLRHHADDFIAQWGVKDKTASDFKRALEWLCDWLRAAPLPITVEAVTRRAAGDFIVQSLEATRSAKKAKSYLAFLRAYWEYLDRRGALTSGNPWLGQRISKAAQVRSRSQIAEEKRPFTDEELAALLSNCGADPELLLAMHIAALGGMRIEEICRLRLWDCSGGVFSVREGKTVNAVRQFPIHTRLADTVAARVKKGNRDDYLIRGLRESTPSSPQRSHPLVKRFTRYRRKVGVGSGRSEHSSVDFHSFRRWFARKARDAMLAGDAGFDEWTLTWIMGHTDKDRPKSVELSQRGYAGMDPMEAKRRLIEAIQLPPQTGETQQ